MHVYMYVLVTPSFTLQYFCIFACIFVLYLFIYLYIYFKYIIGFYASAATYATALNTSFLQDLEIAADFILTSGVPCILQALKHRDYVKVLYFFSLV